MENFIHEKEVVIPDQSIGSPEQFLRENEVVAAIKTVYKERQDWPASNAQLRWSSMSPTVAFRSSVYSASYTDTLEGGEAYSGRLKEDPFVLLEQGSCAFVPRNDAQLVGSVGFSRCIAYTHCTDAGIFFAHITEYDDTFAKLREQVLRVYGVGKECLFVPQANEEGASVFRQQDKKQLDILIRESKDIDVSNIPYRWSDLPPSKEGIEYSSGIFVTKTAFKIIPLFVKEVDEVGFPIYELDHRR